MKTMILVAAVAAFEFAFVVSIATPPSGPAAETATATARSVEQRSGALAQRAGAKLPCTQLPCTPPG